MDSSCEETLQESAESSDAETTTVLDSDETTTVLGSDETTARCGCSEMIPESQSMTIISEVAPILTKDKISVVETHRRYRRRSRMNTSEEKKQMRRRRKRVKGMSRECNKKRTYTNH